MSAPNPTDFSRIKAIYFDLDDTLCGYWDASKAGLRQAFEKVRPEGISVDDMVIHWGEAFRKFSRGLKDTHWYELYLTSGEPTRTEQMRLTLQEAGIEDAAMAAAMSQAYMELRDANFKPFADTYAVLDLLKPAFKLGLITNGPADIQRQEIGTAKLESYFEHFFIEGEMRVGKPEPVVFDKAREAVGLEPDEILMVGNSYGHDIRPAVAAGWLTAWIRRPSDVPPSAKTPGKPEELPAGAPEPTVTINELSELLPLLLPKAAAV